jgi:multiple sugar transport system substrate-binding protein
MLKCWLAGIALAASFTASAAEEIQLHVFSGGANQRPDLIRKVFDDYEHKHPGVRIQLETGGATSELQRQYLSTVLSAKDSTLDLLALDIVNPAQFSAAGWLEPLDAYLGAGKEKRLKEYLPAYARSNVIGGKLVALPFVADAMFLYYRKDLLEKYKQPVPKTWDELASVSRKIQEGEKGNLQGLSFQGAAIEGAVCTFLLPYWSQGKELQDANGKLSLDKPAAVRGLKSWLSLVDQGVAKKNTAEVTTGDTVNEFKAGKVLFGINWGFAWDRFQQDKDSAVRDKVGVAVLPALAGGKSASCIGGWQWGVSAFSKHKAESVRLAEYLSTPEVAKYLAVEGSLLPVYPQVYTDPDVVKAVPWFASAGPVVQSARSRPVSPRYSEVSDKIRTVTHAALAGATSPEQAVDDIESGLVRVLR